MAATVGTAVQLRPAISEVASLDDVVPGMVGRDDAAQAPHNERYNERYIVPSIEVPARSLQGPAPDLDIARDNRLAPNRAESRIRGQFVAFVAASFIAHIALTAMLNREPAPLASVGEDVISIEIVVGADTAAGVAETADQTEAENPIAAEATQPEEPKDQRPVETEPPERVPESPVAVAHAERKTDDTDAPTERRDDAVVEPKRLAVPSVPSSGIGRGQSAPDAKYFGRVAAHLARRKQYPSEARSKRQQGTGTVKFTIDAAGQVSAIELVKRTGIAALDREIEAMVRRAAPFPPPPNGAAVNFAAPVSFRMN